MRFRKRNDEWTKLPLRYGRWQRWYKMLLGIDPLVGMFIVSYPVVGVILARIETGSAPKYLGHIFNATGDSKFFENHFVMDIPGPGRDHWDLFYSLKEAQRWCECIDRAKRESPVPESTAFAEPSADGWEAELKKVSQQSCIGSLSLQHCCA